MASDYDGMLISHLLEIVKKAEAYAGIPVITQREQRRLWEQEKWIDPSFAEGEPDDYIEFDA